MNLLANIYPEGIQVGHLPGEFTGLQLHDNIDIAISKARSENIKLSLLYVAIISPPFLATIVTRKNAKAPFSSGNRHLEIYIFETFCHKDLSLYANFRVQSCCTQLVDQLLVKVCIEKTKRKAVFVGAPGWVECTAGD